MSEQFQLLKASNGWNSSIVSEQPRCQNQGMADGSKPLSHEDESGFHFVREILAGDPTYAINFDRLQRHPKLGYLIFEFLLTDESQKVTPNTSHPNKYWNKNSRKFLALWQATKDLQATLFLVNYAKLGTKHKDKVTAIKVLDMDPNKGITRELKRDFSRAEFGEWFRQLNRECR